MVRHMLLSLMGLVVLAPAVAGAFCFEDAAEAHGVPAGLLWAIAKVESGFDPLAVQVNGDGSVDFGVMQINSSWVGRWPEVTEDALRDPCTNVHIGAKVLADCLARFGYTWEGIGCYNALSLDKRAAYARRVIAVIESMDP
jgi:soluble lytic murein transglycosylase-like protein